MLKGILVVIAFCACLAANAQAAMVTLNYTGYVISTGKDDDFFGDGPPIVQGDAFSMTLRYEGSAPGADPGTPGVLVYHNSMGLAGTLEFQIGAYSYTTPVDINFQITIADNFTPPAEGVDAMRLDINPATPLPMTPRFSLDSFSGSLTTTNTSILSSAALPSSAEFSDASIFNATRSFQFFFVNSEGDVISRIVEIVPEPGAGMLLLLGSGLALGMRRRRS